MLVEEAEYRKLLKQAKTEGKSLGEWVRESLRTVLRLSAGRPPEEKISRIRELAQKNSFPISDIDTLLKEIEQGYKSDLR